MKSRIGHILARLMRPLPASLVKTRDGHEIKKSGKSYDPPRYFQLSYVEWHTKWMSVLAAAPDAAWEVVKWESGQSGFIVHGRLTIEGVSRDGMGWAAMKMSGQKPNAVDIGIKDAETDALARCCVKFGSGIGLYGVSDSIVRAFQRLHGDEEGGQEDAEDDPEPPSDHQPPPEGSNAQGGSRLSPRDEYTRAVKAQEFVSDDPDHPYVGYRMVDAPGGSHAVLVTASDIELDGSRGVTFYSGKPAPTETTPVGASPTHTQTSSTRPPTQPSTTTGAGTETGADIARRMAEEAPPRIDEDEIPFHPDDRDDPAQVKIGEEGLIHSIVAGPLLDKIRSDVKQDRRAAEYDLRARLKKSYPIVLGRIAEVTGTRMSSNAFELALQQGQGKGIDLTPASLTLLLHLLVVPSEWDDGMKSSVSSYWIDVKAGVVT